MDKTLTVDLVRMADWLESGIYVRAQFPDGHFDSVDIYYLSRESLLRWLKSRGGDNPWAENTVGILLGHGPLHRQRAQTWRCNECGSSEYTGSASGEDIIGMSCSNCGGWDFTYG